MLQVLQRSPALRTAFVTIPGMTTRRIFSFAIVLALAITASALLNSNPANSIIAATSRDSLTSVASPFEVAPDLDARLARFQQFEMPFNRSGLSEREQQMVQKLVDAANRIEQIYWRQSDPDGLKLYGQLLKSQDPTDRKVLRFMTINGSRYDLIDELRPFVGKDLAPKGRALYPRDVTQAYIDDSYLKLYPAQRNEIYDERTVVRLKSLPDPRDVMRLTTVPYHEAFAEFLKPAAEDLR